MNGHAASPPSQQAEACSLAFGRTPEQSQGRGRIAFADQLRGVAALLVVLAHHGALYWVTQPAVVYLTGLPPAFLAPPPSTLPWSSLLTNGVFDAGASGVALFFLISGYVIPFSLRGRDWTGFLIARAVRLLPTFWVGFGVQVGVLVVVHRLLGGHIPRTPHELLFNMLPGLQLLAWRPSLDGIVWTLNVEVFFYLLCATAALLILRRAALVLCLPAATAMVGGVLALQSGWVAGMQADLRGALYGLTFAAPFLVFMFIGTVLHLAEVDRRWRLPALGLVPLMFALFAGLMRWNPNGALFAQVPSYLMMATLFVVAFTLRARIPAFRLPTWLASISYPLYVVHSISGYALMSLAWSVGWPPLACFVLALCYSIGAALVLHRLVETPTMRLSSRLGRLNRSRIAGG